ncbi:hypothetical protein ES707_07415 [subsurface metagenome]
MNENKAILKEDGTVEFVTPARYAAAVMRTVDSGKNTLVDPTMNEQTLTHHFTKIKELKVSVGEDIGNITEIEKDVLQWFRVENPVSKMTDDLKSRNCSEATIRTYKSVATSFMRMHDFEPQFTLSEFNLFVNSYENAPTSTRKSYRSILELLWEIQGLTFPLKRRRMHESHSIMPIIPPTLYPDKIARIIKAVKDRGTPEEKYYFCLATVFAPRRIELGEITAQNFMWNGKTGTLIFNPCKHGVTRKHHISEELTPYLKGFSQEVSHHRPDSMTRKFWNFVNHLDLPVPKLSKAEKREYRTKRQRPRQFGWHAFRHGLTVGLSQAGISDTAVNRWMGWRSGSQASPMVSIYFTPEDMDTDSIVMRKHPFLKLWRKQD